MRILLYTSPLPDHGRPPMRLASRPLFTFKAGRRAWALLQGYAA